MRRSAQRGLSPVLPAAGSVPCASCASGFALADLGAHDLSVTPTGDSVDIEYRTAAFKSLAARNHALASGAK